MKPGCANRVCALFITEACIDRAAVIECRAECGPESMKEKKEKKNELEKEESKPGFMGEKATTASAESMYPTVATTEKKYVESSDTASFLSACDEHKRAAHEKYRAVAGVLSCICRILMTRNLEPCCGQQQKQKREARRQPASTHSHEEGHGHGHEHGHGHGHGHATAHRGHGAKHSHSHAKATGHSHHSRAHNLKDRKAARDKANAIKHAQATSVGRQEIQSSDPEKGAAETEHIIMSVSGMTCSGCELKLTRTLANFEQVQNLQVSVILARAAFDLDTSRMSFDELLTYLRRATEFSYERISTKGHEIHVLCPQGSKPFVKNRQPLGVMGIKIVSDKIVRIEYDPKIIGARDVLNSFGAPLQLAPMKSPESIEAGMKEVRKDGMITLFSLLLTIPILVFAWAPLPEHPVAYGSASLALATIIQIFVAGPFYSVAFKNIIFSRLVEVDMLIVLSTSAAYIFSLVAFAYEMQGRPLETGEFFETSALIVTLIMLGRFISSWARQRAAESISVRTLQSSTAILIDQATGAETDIDARLLQFGDIFKVSPDSRIVTDGTVISGASEADESMVTGESRPVPKKTRSTVIAGSINGPGLLQVRISRLPGDNTISAIADMVDEAKMTKAKAQEIADRIAGYFVPVVCAITVLVFVGWIGFGIDQRNYLGSRAAENAVTYAIAVLIVSCPCAIGLCVPMVIVIAGGVAAKHGVIFKTGQTIELAKKTRHVVFDKTGTLTQGNLTVVAEAFPAGDAASIKPLVLGLVASVKHPVSIAVSKYLGDKAMKPIELGDVTTLVGKGVEGIFNGSKVRAGNSRWLHVEDDRNVQAFLARGLSVFCVMKDNQLHAVFGLEDSIRPDSEEVVSELRNRGVAISIVSGDDDGAVQALAAKLSIPTSHVKSRCSPKDKVAYLKEIMNDPASVVVFCGDGTNDAPALAQATIGVHINTEGSDVAQSAADAVLVRPALKGLLCLIDLSHASVRRIVFNFAWSFTYNLFAVLLASGLFVKFRIPPEYAGLGEVVSIIPVIAIAMLLKYAKLKGCDGNH
ncbi:Cu2+-exporting ATPase [Exophiala aquamarina CBS 119918]|uniref:Cu2+-exporting ATPase n=1 Tax=Exophiala aquamarina CBS 119918 TaxID=1182545 RepID=A0A072NWZ8_9EURO|nr:Cu2+-exporting ATPase [Exophiala aquamarina CBS 119918]KEF51563.1 Cu2+-exporting ATPase [Exophiala aquamarina CBS 119918]